MTTEKRMRDMVKYVKAQWGNGWNRLGSELQIALIRAEVLAEVARIAHFNKDPGEYRKFVEDVATAGIQWEPEQ